MRYVIVFFAIFTFAAAAYAERFEFSSYPGLEIPRDDSIGVWDSIYVDQAIQIDDLNVFLGIDVHWCVDMFAIPVYSPWADSVYLVNLSDNHDSLNVWFDTQAIEDGPGELEDYEGHISTGWWKLNPRCVYGGGTNYVLDCWKIEIYGELQSAVGDSARLPLEFGIDGAYPNPFNARTIINYSLPEKADITIAVYNLLGQKVATLFDGAQQPGQHKVTWDASDYPSGVYLARLQSGDRSENIKLVLLK
ncbi:MAG: T9SS type A sorting domain-containing protein [Candidatus Zixiibacteriota bacterium]|nr:MAG: T9SS type A sorting domain-containing protein [candidate division Zixibacteria bacterium]